MTQLNSQVDLRPLLDHFYTTVQRAQLAPGTWARWTSGVPDKDHGVNPYGCADAINILSTLQRLPPNRAELDAATVTLQQMQGDDGLFHESTHHPIHCTAHCIAALDLLLAKPLRPITALAEWTDPARVGEFMEALPWRDNPWSGSHRGAGIYAALHLAGDVTPAWEDSYFQWLWDEADPETGFWRKGYQGPCISHKNSEFPHLAGSFHYLFNHEHARRPLRYPDKMIDSCLRLLASDPFPIGKTTGFAEIDWVYCLTRAQRQTNHRWDEARATLRQFAASYVAQLSARNATSDPGLNDLHTLFGVTCCLAELQAALPGELRSDKPLHLVLDRRPFI